MKYTFEETLALIAKANGIKKTDEEIQDISNACQVSEIIDPFLNLDK